MMRAMRWLSLFLLVAVSAGCATRSDVDAERSKVDAERLEGKWEVAAVHRNGALDPTEVGSTLTFTGNNVHFTRSFVVPPAPRELQPELR